MRSFFNRLRIPTNKEAALHKSLDTEAQPLRAALSGGAKTDGMVMPDLTGQMFATAAFAVTHAGLKLAPPLDTAVSIAPVSAAGGAQTPSAPIPAGTVVGQAPPPGHLVDAETPVQLTVARWPEVG